MLGYWRALAPTTAVMRGEWLVSGDLAAMDDDGYVWYHGRHDDILNPQGYRIARGRSPMRSAASLSLSRPGCRRRNPRLITFC